MAKKNKSPRECMWDCKAGWNLGQAIKELKKAYWGDCGGLGGVLKAMAEGKGQRTSAEHPVLRIDVLPKEVPNLPA